MEDQVKQQYDSVWQSHYQVKFAAIAAAALAAAAEAAALSAYKFAHPGSPPEFSDEEGSE